MARVGIAEQEGRAGYYYPALPCSVLTILMTTNTQSKVYCFTLNNYTEDEFQSICGLYDGGGVQYLIVGRERGDSGTPHLQGFIRWATKKRFNAARDAISGRAHLSTAKGTDEQNQKYCSKDGDFREWGTPVDRRGGSGCQFTYFRDWCRGYYDDNGAIPTERAIADAFPALYVRYRKNVLDLSLAVCPCPEFVDPDTVELRGWQRDLEQRLGEQPDDRTVEFIIDTLGGKGKSWFQRYMYTKHEDVQLLSIGKRDDIAYAIDATKRIYFFNIPRGGMEFLQYTNLEGLKDRVVFSTKYQSTTKLLTQTPHVVVFCNEEVDRNKMSADRYKVTRLI